ncbi:AEC family transporter [Methylobacterium sp. NEAU K]|uniref:AEC family transporter n=1 Tax=Methylobacterium sp. NEAU K TaxID=3064946 RepID=UPI00273489D9|nr:AEC family transporter [Methylobacterium sp. NEAU K]MDP4003978.1 AEC family transporter [Methylobacterium sp. NEAU K]
MQAVLNAAVPIFALILVGFLCGRLGAFAREATDSINRFAVYLALPALIFTTMARITPAEIGQFGFATGFAGGIAVTFALAFWLARRRGGSMADASIEGLDAGYSNVGFMGIPLCLLVFGPDGLPAAVIATLFTACVLFLTAIVLVELDLRRGAGRLGAMRRVAVSLLRNPLFLAPIAGLGVGLTGLPLPLPLETAAKLLGGAASPCALICIGLFLAQESALAGNARQIGLLVVLKLLFQPAVTALFVFGLFDMPPLWARAAVLLSALPIGSGPFTIAKLYGLQTGVTSGAILISHLVSVLTVSALVAWLG